MQRINIVDSHTGGEPTRIVIAGGPDLGRGSLAARRERFQRDFDHYRSAVVNEPRGSDVVVGALLVEPKDKSCACGVIFFNNVGYLGMCGHGTIGLVVTLAHLGQIKPGEHKIETPVGIVTATLHPGGEVSVANVPSWRAKQAVTVDVPGIGKVTGDVAWGGNWFFLVAGHGQHLALANTDALTDYCWRVRQAINAQGFPEIDHVELFGPPTVAGAHSRNFVQCPGKAYDRSPCGTGTSAKLACLAADGKLAEGETWIQESIIGSTFAGEYQWLDRAAGKISPIITGTAFVNAEATLLLEEKDPFCWGIAAGSGTAAKIAALDRERSGPPESGNPCRSPEPEALGLRPASPLPFPPETKAAILAAVPEPSATPPWPHAPPHWLFHPGTYFVTASTYQRARLLDSPAKLEAVTHRLIDSAGKFGWTLRAWAVLANHYHLVAESPAGSAASLRDWLQNLHRTSAQRVNELAGQRGRRVWMNYRETRLTHQTSYLARLRYVNENAVHHQLVRRARDYRWCSAAWFETNAPKSFVASVARFKTDRVNVWDEFDD